MIKSKKVKVDMNPKKVQNPADAHKRSPGKFDQKVVHCSVQLLFYCVQNWMVWITYVWPILIVSFNTKKRTYCNCNSSSCVLISMQNTECHVGFPWLAILYWNTTLNHTYVYIRTLVWWGDGVQLVIQGVVMIAAHIKLNWFI